MLDQPTQEPLSGPSTGDQVMELIEDAVVIAASDGSILRWNPAAERIFGWTESEAQDLSLVALTAEEGGCGMADAARQIFGGGSRWTGEISFNRKDGASGLANATARRMDDGRALIVVRDITILSHRRDQLEREHRLLRALLDAIPDFIFLKDRTGRYLYRNRGERDRSGFEDQDFIGRTSLEAPIPAEIASRYYADDMAVVDSGRAVVNRQEPFTLPDGQTGWFLTSKYPTRDPLGRVTGLVGIAREITELRRNTEELAANRERMGAHLDHLLLAIIELDANLRVIRWAGRAPDLFGWKVEEAMGRSIHEFNLVHPDDADDVWRMFQTLPENNEKCCVHQNRNTDRQGRVHHCLWYNSVVQAADGEVISYLCLAQEVTLQVEAVEKLKGSERLLQTLIDATNTGYALLDARGRILSVNGKYLSAFGLSRPEEFSERLFSSFIAPTQQGQFILEMSRLLETGQLHEVEIEVHSGTGKVTPFEINARVEQTSAGSRIHMFYRDISARYREIEEHKALERKLQETQKLESLGVLAGGIAHDFNNLLTGILGNASLAASVVGTGSPVQLYLDQVEKASLRAADLCKQMLAYSGKGRFVVKETDLNALVTETTALLRISITKRAMIQMRLAPTMPAVNADATQLRQVIMNLVINAGDALGEQPGTIIISTGAQNMTAAELAAAHAPGDAVPGEYVWYEVADTGCGMTPEVLAKIFDPFFTTKFTGRGLGLAAVLGIVRSHRGALQVASQPGQGTTFRVLLPSARRPARDIPGPPSTVTGWRGVGTVLLVDDEETVRITTGRMLEGIGFTVLTAGDGAEALEVLALHPEVKFVLLDLSMPKKDGVETYKEIRKLRSNARVLLMSGFTKIEAMKRFRMEGLSGFIQKPFTMRQLAEKAKATLAH